MYDRYCSILASRMQSCRTNSYLCMCTAVLLYCCTGGMSGWCRCDHSYGRVVAGRGAVRVRWRYATGEVSHTVFCGTCFDFCQCRSSLEVGSFTEAFSLILPRMPCALQQSTVVSMSKACVGGAWRVLLLYSCMFGVIVPNIRAEAPY